MEAIPVLAAKTGSQLSFSSRTHLLPVNKLSHFPLTSCPLKPKKLVSLKANSTLTCCDGQENNRKFQKFPPSIWTHRFDSVLVDASEMDALRREIDKIIPNVRKTLMSSQEDDSTKKRILMIYLLVSLGLAYHFEDEIEESLKEDFEKIEEIVDGEDDLYTISIIFWVFRTYGHHISSDIFNQFKGNKGKFKEYLSEDPKGLLALYEAAHLATTKDNIMDEALSFASSHLESLASDSTCSPHLSLHIRNALTLSQHGNMEILVAVKYITFYEQEEDHDKTLLRFAKLNFNLLQLHYLEELKIVTKWYQDKDFASNLPPYFRYVIVETHFIGTSMYLEPKFSQRRIMFTKFLTVSVIVDDTFDRYASIPEAESLANSLERWTPDDAMEKHPNYLKFVFKFLVGCFQEFEREMASEGRSYCVKATREELNIMVKGCLDLAKCGQAGLMLSFEEYMEIGKPEVGVYAMLAGTLMSMGHNATEEAYEWLKSRPKLIQSASIKGRLMNDIAGFEDDMSRGFVATGVNCYMKQYGVTKLKAIRDLLKRVVDADKIINEEFLMNSDVPIQIRNIIFKTARTANVCYKEGEGFTYTKGKFDEKINSLFVNKIHL